MKEKTKIIREITEKLLELMGVEATIEIDYSKEEDLYQIKIDTKEETGLLIGSRGETINAIQAFVGMSLKSKTDEWTRVLVDIAGWREKQNQKIVEIAQSAAVRARETDQDQPLYNLSAAERRVVHTALKNEKDLSTESFGEGKERYLIIRLAKNSGK